MINRIVYMQELENKLLELPHVREITSSDMMFIRFSTDNSTIFEISMIQFNSVRFAITFDISVSGSNSCIGNISWLELKNKKSPFSWEEIYRVEGGLCR